MRLSYCTCHALTCAALLCSDLLSSQLMFPAVPCSTQIMADIDLLKTALPRHALHPTSLFLALSCPAVPFPVLIIIRRSPAGAEDRRCWPQWHLADILATGGCRERLENSGMIARNMLNSPRQHTLGPLEYCGPLHGYI